MRKARIRRDWVSFVVMAALSAAVIASPRAAAAMMTPRLKPPAPGPVYVTRGDLDLLNETREAVRHRQWSTARAAARKIVDPIAKDLADWFYFYGEDPDVDLKAADAFLDTHPDWPALSKIQMHAERRLTENTPARDVLDFFDNRDPLTGEGKLHLARAQFTAGDNEAALAHMRDAWVNHNLVFSDERRLLADYGGRLTEKDHAARVDRLLWERQVTASRRIYSRLDSRDRRMAEARAALLMRSSNGPDLYYALKEEERLDPGVLLAAVRYYRRTDEEPRAVALALKAPTDPDALRNPSRWWDERQLLIRWALSEHQYTDAYALAASHGLPPGLDFAEAEFDAGWIALRFLDAPERAEVHFKALAGAVGAPISLARAYYWLGRSAEARDEADLAAARYRVAASYPYAFYGQMAAEELGGDLPAATFAPPVEPTPEDKARFSSRPAVAALRILSELDADQAFLIFAYNVDDQLETPGEYVELARLADRKGATHIAVRAGKVGVRRNAFAAEVVYPLIFVPDEATRFAPHEVILGLSRQESEFNPRAYSRAGARGLMQLLPSTARITARKEGLRYSRSALLNDPVYNLIVGSAHLSHLFKRFNGSRVMTFAAYNAGAARVDEWIERYGDPRAPDIDPLDWVEQIPFAETRNYVQRVLENTQVYRARLNHAPIAGKLTADLELGGPPKRAGRLPNQKHSDALPPLPERTVLFASAAPIAHSQKALLDAEPAATNAAPDDAPATPFAEANAAGVRADSAPPINAAPGGNEGADAKAGAKRSSRARQRSTKPQPALSEFLDSKRNHDELGQATKETPADQPAAIVEDVSQVVALSSPDDAEAHAAASAGSNTLSAIETVAAADENSCQTYTAYIASTDKEDAAAADLNAGMLAELQSGSASGCTTDIPVDEPAAE